MCLWYMKYISICDSHTQACAYESQRSVSGVFSFMLLFVFLRESLSLRLELKFLLRWLARYPMESVYLSPTLGTAGVC